MKNRKTIVDHILAAVVPVRAGGKIVGIAHIANSGAVTRRGFDAAARQTWHAEGDVTEDQHLVQSLEAERSVREELERTDASEAVATASTLSAAAFC